RFTSLIPASWPGWSCRRSEVAARFGDFIAYLFAFDPGRFRSSSKPLDRHAAHLPDKFLRDRLESFHNRPAPFQPAGARLIFSSPPSRRRSRLFHIELSLISLRY